MAELTASNAWSAPLRCANQSFDRQDPLNNQMLPIRYPGEPAGQLGQLAPSRNHEKVSILGWHHHAAFHCRVHNSQSCYAVMGWASGIRSNFKLGCPRLYGRVEGWNEGLHLEKSLERQLWRPPGQTVIHNQRRRQGDQVVIREHASDHAQVVMPRAYILRSK